MGSRQINVYIIKREVCCPPHGSPVLAGMAPCVRPDLAECLTRHPHSNEGLLDYPPQSLDQHNKGTLASVRAGGGGPRVGYLV